MGANRKGLRIVSVLPVAVFILWSAPTPTVLVVPTGLALLGLLVVEVLGRQPRKQAAGEDGFPVV